MYYRDMTNTRCEAKFTIASGVRRGERVQCLKAAVTESGRCRAHAYPWEKK